MKFFRNTMLAHSELETNCERLKWFVCNKDKLMINTDWCCFSVQAENILNCNFVLKIFVWRLSQGLGAAGVVRSDIRDIRLRICDPEPLEHPQWEIWEIGNVRTVSIMDWDGLGKLAPMMRSHNRLAHSGISWWHCFLSSTDAAARLLS